MKLTFTKLDTDFLHLVVPSIIYHQQEELYSNTLKDQFFKLDYGCYLLSRTLKFLVPSVMDGCKQKIKNQLFLTGLIFLL